MRHAFRDTNGIRLVRKVREKEERERKRKEERERKRKEKKTY